MRQVLLATIALGALASGASAQIFNTGVGFSVGQTNSPGDASDTVSFTPGLHVLQGGALDLTISIVNDASFSTTGAQWAVFSYSTPSFDALSAGGENWSIEQVGIPLLVNTNFIGDFTQWTTEGQTIAQTGKIFGQTIMANPVPGGHGNGEGTLGFIDPIPAGPAPQLGAFADPFSIVINGLGGTVPTGFTQALEFEPAGGVTPSIPEPSTWVMVGIGFGFMAWGAATRKRLREFY
jgi:hypothetical protein